MVRVKGRCFSFVAHSDSISDGISLNSYKIPHIAYIVWVHCIIIDWSEPGAPTKYMYWIYGHGMFTKRNCQCHLPLQNVQVHGPTAYNIKEAEDEISIVAYGFPGSVHPQKSQRVLKAYKVVLHPNTPQGYNVHVYGRAI